MLGIEQAGASGRRPADFLWVQDLEVREAALEVIINSDADQHEDDLVLVMTDPDNELRETAVDLLTDRGGDLAIRLLRRAVYDPHPSVRQAALEGLRELGAAP